MLPATATFFTLHKQKKDGLAPQCRQCDSDWAKDPIVKAKRNAQRRARRIAHPEKTRERERAVHARKRVKKAARSKIRKANWKAAHPDRYEASNRHYRQENREACNARNTVYARKRYKNDPDFRLLWLIRTRTLKALKGISKSATTRALLGATTEELRAHIESQFAPGMSWGDPGSWELDHKWPLSLFDLNDPRQLRVAANYKNLQPLSFAENRSKGNRLRGDEAEAFELWRSLL